MNVVVALPVAESERNIGLAEDDGARILEARHGEGVFLSDEIFERGYAPGGRQSGDIVRFLDRDRDAKERPPLAAREGRIRLPRRFPSAREIAHRHGVEIPVESLDSRDELVRQLESRDLLLR